MNDKSYVTMEQNQCPICLVMFDTNALLLDRRLRERFEMHTMTGHSPCPTCKEKLDDGFIALIEISNTPSGEKMQPSEATYSGRHAFLKREVALDMFDIEPEQFNFCDGQLLDMLERATEHSA